MVYARKDETHPWSGGIIHEILSEGRLYIVKYVKTNEFGGVSPANIVASLQAIPKGERIDSMDNNNHFPCDNFKSSPHKKSYESEYYLDKVEDCSNLVVKEWSVSTSAIKRGLDISRTELGHTSSISKLGHASSISKLGHASSRSELGTNVSKKKFGPCYNARIFAKAISDAASSCSVADDSFDKNGSITGIYVPQSLLCIVCRTVCKRAMRLSCNELPVCWGCAVKKFTTLHACWECGEKNVTSEKHLVKDQELRLRIKNLHGKEVKKENEIESVTSLGSPRPSESSSYKNIDTLKVELDSLLNYEIDMIKREVDSSKLESETRRIGGSYVMEARLSFKLNTVYKPLHVAMLADKSFAVVCESINHVLRFDTNGCLVGNIASDWKFSNPSELLLLSSGELVVRDDDGLQLFEKDYLSYYSFTCFLAKNNIISCVGLAEDQHGHVITINNNFQQYEYKNSVTSLGTTDIFFIDKVSTNVYKRFEMFDLITAAREQFEMSTSKCSLLAYSNGKVYVGDTAMCCIFSLEEDGESEIFGNMGCGDGEFREPSGIVFDDEGNMIISDSINNTLQIFDTNGQFLGYVKVDQSLTKPSGIFFDRENRDIYVSDYFGRCVSRFSIRSW